MGLVETMDVWKYGAGAIITVGAILSALVYAFGNALQNEKMKAWAKMEIFEVFYSLVIIAMTATLLTSFDTIAYSILHNNGYTLAYFPHLDGNTNEVIYGQKNICAQTAAAYSPQEDKLEETELSIYEGVPYCHMRVAIYFLEEVFKEAKYTGYSIYQLYTITSTIADMAINIEYLTEAPGFFTMTPWRGFFAMGNKFNEVAFDFAIKIMTIAKMQAILLVFISKALFPTLMIVGAFLRTFAFTRRLGGLLMAIALSLFFIFPLFYDLGAIIIIDIKNSARAQLPDPAKEDPGIAGNFKMKGTIPIFSSGSFEEGLKELKRRELAESAAATRTNIGRGGGLPSMTLDVTRSTADEEARINAGSGGFLDKLKGLFEQLRQFASMKWWEIGAKIVNFEPGGLMDVFAKLAFFTMFFGFFGVIAAIAAIRSISITLGGDIEIAGLTHII